MAHHGEVTDSLFKSGQLDEVHDFLKRVRDAGMLVGVSTHMPAVVDAIESKGWDLDYYMTCVYERHRSAADLEKLLGQVPIPVGEVYLPKDPPRMFEAIRKTKRPCLAFKILAAGRLSERKEWVEQAFRETFAGDQAQRRRDHRHLRPLQRPARRRRGVRAALRRGGWGIASAASGAPAAPGFQQSAFSYQQSRLGRQPQLSGFAAHPRENRLPYLGQAKPLCPLGDIGPIDLVAADLQHGGNVAEVFVPVFLVASQAGRGHLAENDILGAGHVRIHSRQNLHASPPLHLRCGPTRCPEVGGS